jgi:acyl carrier protein
MDFLEVFNQVINHAVTRPENAKDATDYNVEPIDIGLDSLDVVMVVAVLTDVYGIPDDAEFDDVSKVTVGTLRDYINTNKTKDPKSMEDVMGCV